MSGEVGHFELPADNLERARKFYSSTFGWKMTQAPGMEYTMVTTGPVDEKRMPKEPGYVGGGIAKRAGLLEHPVVTILVEEISTVEKMIEKNGGKVLQPKQAIGDGSMGWSGYFKDSEGNVVGLYQMPKRA
jgi:predicted enzyme related to lactoylglutathione lyase